jgi:hypothetical protein
MAPFIPDLRVMVQASPGHNIGSRGLDRLREYECAIGSCIDL